MTVGFATLASVSPPELVPPRTTRTQLALAALPYVPRLAVRWLADRTPVAHRRVDGSLMFADVSGFTRLSERLARNGRVGAEEVVGLVSEVLTALIAEIEARGGDVLVFAGDALVVLFDGDEAERRAASTAASIRRWFEGRGSIPTSVGRVTLRVSIGVTSGPVDLVLAGGTARGIFVAGRTTTAMVRLERAADAGEILVDDRVAAALDPAWLGDVRSGGRLLRRSAALSWLAGPDRPTGSGPGTSRSGGGTRLRSTSTSHHSSLRLSARSLPAAVRWRASTGSRRSRSSWPGISTTGSNESRQLCPPISMRSTGLRQRAPIATG